MNRIEEIKIKVAPIFEENKISSASIFGSTARGEESNKSDVDFLIKFSGNYGGLFAMARLKRSLEKTLKKKVDLTTFRSINSRLKKNILNDAIKIYEKR